MRHAIWLCMMISLKTLGQNFKPVFVLSPDRIEKIKHSTVRISSRSGNIGTGFIINERCQILTCFHVIEPYLNDTTQSYISDSAMSLVVTFYNWRSFALKKFVISFRNYSIDSMRKYDFAILEPIAIPPIKFEYIKLGSWNDAVEGQAIYTCGFPLAMREPFIVTGMLSRKVDQVSSYNPGDSKPIIETHLHYAYLDLNLSHGNSGSPIVAMSDSPEDDRVIGIADFIENATNDNVNRIVKKYSKEPIGKDTMINDIKIKTAIVSLAFGVVNTANGITGCYSIEYANKLLKR
jgi:S1-C subfamily serine protease